MKKNKPPKFSGSRETFLIFIVAGCGIMATLSVNLFQHQESPPSEAKLIESDQSPQDAAESKSAPVNIMDVPLATGTEPLDKLFVQSGCAVCHTIPGIGPACCRQSNGGDCCRV